MRTRVVLAVLLCGALTGCKTSFWEEPAYPLEVPQRHPIALAQRANSLELFPRSRKGLDARQVADVRAFGRDFLGRAAPGARITMTVPVASGQPAPEMKAAATAARDALSSVGVVRFEAVPDEVGAAATAQPIRLSFPALGAAVESHCGQWPYDLASSELEGWQNEPYYNLGCATQANIAAQIDDPLDLLRPRAEAPVSAARRLQALQQASQPASGAAAGQGNGQQAASATGGN